MLLINPKSLNPSLLNSFFTAGEVAAAGPSRVSDSSVPAETVVYETIVVMGELGWDFSVLPAWRKGKV